MSASIRESLRGLPGPFFGDYGGRFMPESLIAAIDELAAAYEDAKADPAYDFTMLFYGGVSPSFGGAKFHAIVNPFL